MHPSYVQGEVLQSKLRECQQLTHLCDLSRRVRDSTGALNAELDKIIEHLEVMGQVMSNWASVFDNVRTIGDRVETGQGQVDTLTLVAIPAHTLSKEADQPSDNTTNLV
ncbi:hypothetical protein IWQ61_006057 [Dispira simplex]|nr:hypothetical protein IWQ61_006057 [Dispira simplex]